MRIPMLIISVLPNGQYIAVVATKILIVAALPIVGSTTCREDPDSWEPGDAMKGDAARMMLYMDVRWEGRGDGGTPDHQLENRITHQSGNQLSRFGVLCSLIAWHVADPVSEWERRLNDRVYAWQGNRIPFIDHPEWVLPFWGTTCSNVTPPEPQGNVKSELRSIHSVQYIQYTVQ